MPWNQLDARSHKGIRVTFKDGKVEDFLHSGRIKFSAIVWDSNYSTDKSHGELRIGDWDSEGKWRDSASFPSGSYAFVKIIV